MRERLHNHAEATIGTTMPSAEDMFKYAAALLDERAEWALGSIASTESGDDHENALNGMQAIVEEIGCMAEEFGDPNRYSCGRRIRTQIDVQRGLVTEHIWHPDPGSEAVLSWTGDLPPKVDGGPPRGRYEVTIDPWTQDVTVITRVKQVRGG